MIYSYLQRVPSVFQWHQPQRQLATMAKLHLDYHNIRGQIKQKNKMFQWDGTFTQKLNVKVPAVKKESSVDVSTEKERTT